MTDGPHGVMDVDRQAERNAIVAGFNGCRRMQHVRTGAGEDCDCDCGAIDGCKARVEAIAWAIAAARSK